MAFLDPQDTLSPIAQGALWLSCLILLAVLCWASPRTALLSLLVLAVPVELFRRHLHDRPGTRPGHLDAVVWTFLASGTIGLSAVAALQTALLPFFARLLFASRAPAYFEEFGRTSLAGVSSEQRRMRAVMAHSWRYFVFLFLFAFVLAGFLEELMKYSVVAVVAHRQRVRAYVQLWETEYVHYAVAATLGFSVMENIGFIFASRAEKGTMLALTVLERIVIAIPAHALSGYLIATRMIRRDLRGEQLRFWQIIAVPAFWHGLFDFTLFVVSAVDGNVGWVHPKRPKMIAAMLFSVVGIISAVWLQVRSDLNQLGLR